MRRQIHMVLGFIAVLCLTLAIYPYHSDPQATLHSETELEVPTQAMTTETKVPNIKVITSSSANPKTVTPTTPNAKTKESHAQIKEVNEPLFEKKPSETLPKLEAKTNTENLPAAATTATTAATTTELDWQTIKIRKNDTLAKVFTRHGFSTKSLQEIMKASKESASLKSLQPGQSLKLQVTNTKQINGLMLEISPGNTLIAARKESGFEILQQQLPVEKKIAFGKGAIQASLISSAKRAGLDNNIVSQMVNIFGGNIDLSLDLHPNDTFKVLFEQNCLPDGERVKTGPILVAEIKNRGKKIQAIRYTDKSGQTAYFSPDGNGLSQAFLRSPVNYTSISSGFGARRHPVYHKMRQHKGVDYVAPRGTPVQSIGDAKVIFVGTRAGYGKVIELAHGSNYTTLYAHLSRFEKKIKVGAEIKKGETIGAVGRTGLATGDHLHFEFRIAGIHRDPLTVALPKSKYIPDAHKRHFLAHAKEMLRLMDVHENKVNVASVEFRVNE